jgi:hypothetical protein
MKRWLFRLSQLYQPCVLIAPFLHMSSGPVASVKNEHFGGSAYKLYYLDLMFYLRWSSTFSSSKGAFISLLSIFSDIVQLLTHYNYLMRNCPLLLRRGPINYECCLSCYLKHYLLTKDGDYYIMQRRTQNLV